MIPTALLLRIGAYAAAVLAVIGAWLWLTTHYEGIGYARAMGEVAAEQQRLKDAQTARETANQSTINVEASDAQNKITTLERQRDVARADADRLQRSVNEFAARARRQVACPSGASPSEQGADPIGMLADMLIRVDREAEAVAGYADRLRIAGESCERSYDAVAGQ